MPLIPVDTSPDFRGLRVTPRRPRQPMPPAQEAPPPGRKTLSEIVAETQARRIPPPPQPSPMERQEDEQPGLFGRIGKAVLNAASFPEGGVDVLRGDIIPGKVPGLLPSIELAQRKFFTPAAAQILRLVPGEQVYEPRAREFEAQGMSTWAAGGAARREAYDAGNWQVKLGMTVQDIAVDPVSYLPVAGLAKMSTKFRRLVPTATQELFSPAIHVPPTRLANSYLGFEPVKVAPPITEQLDNLARQALGRDLPDQAVTHAKEIARSRSRHMDIVRARATEFSARHTVSLNRTFEFDDVGRIPALDGVIKEIPGAPTIQDVAARLPKYSANLTPAQLDALERIRTDLIPYRQLLGDTGLDVGVRRDVRRGGGFYIPRGPGIQPEGPLPVLGRGQLKLGKSKGFEKTELFPSMAHALNKGVVYDTLPEILQKYSLDVGTRTTDQHMANALKGLTDSAGQLLAKTPKQLLMEQNPKIAVQMEDFRATVSRLSARIPRQAERLDRLLIRFIDDPLDADFDAIAKALNSIVIPAARAAQRGLITPAALPEAKFLRGGIREGVRRIRKGKLKAGGEVIRRRATLSELALAKQQLSIFLPTYKAALARTTSATAGKGTIDLEQLRRVTFPDEIASSVNKVLESNKRLIGKGADVVGTVRALNALHRGLRATADFSGLGIQGLLYAANHPIAFGRAAKLHFQALGTKGEDVLGLFFNQHNAQAGIDGTFTTTTWANRGLRLAGQETEYKLGQGVLSRVSGFPGIKQANRAFGFLGDIMRVQWADDMLRGEMRRGRSLDEITRSGDADRIASIANNMTGYSGGRAFGSLGDVLLFAPKFLQARLETVAKGAMGLRPGARIDQRMARNSLLKGIGWGIGLTLGANAALGQETDMRPIITRKGKKIKNPNFLRIRWGGRDWSLFGTWDSLAGAIISTGSGNPQDALRSLGSGAVSISWDLISNKDFMGRPVREDPVEFGSWLLRSTLPFALEEIPSLVEEGVRGDPVAGAAITAEVFGIKSSPLSFVDVRDIAAGELFGLRYDQLTDRGEKSRVNADPRVVKRIDELPDTQGPITEQVEFAFRNFERTVLELESRARQLLSLPNAGGARRRKAVQDLKSGRWLAGQAVFGSPELGEHFDRNPDSVKDQVAAKYWGADAPIGDNGEPDFALRDATRADALRQAAVLGIDKNYILGEGPGTFRRKRFTDPLVSAAVVQYEADQVRMKPYWEVPDTLIEEYPEPVRSIYLAYRREPPEAQRTLRARFRVIPLIDRRVSLVRDNLFRTDPLLSAALLRWGYRLTAAPAAPRSVQTFQQR